jgi:hypothetical protein
MLTGAVIGGTALALALQSSPGLVHAGSNADVAQRSPALAPGGELLAWTDSRSGVSRVYVKRIYENGLPMGGASSLGWVATRSPAGAEQLHPSFTSTGELMWSERRPGAADFDIYVQQVTPAGLPVGEPKLVVGRAGDQLFPSSAYSHVLRRHIVVWSEYDGDDSDIYGIQVSAQLMPIGQPFAVVIAEADQTDPTIIAEGTLETILESCNRVNDGSGFMLVWTDDRQGNLDLWTTRVAGSGRPYGDDPTRGHAPLVQSRHADFGPMLSDTLRDQPGGILVWTRLEQGEGLDLVALRLNGSGLPRGREYRLLRRLSDQSMPTVVERKAPRIEQETERVGQLMVAWEDNAGGGIDLVGVVVEGNGLIRRSAVPLVAER